MKRDIGIVNNLHRTPDGELVAGIGLRNGGLIHNLPNTLSNFQMDEQVRVLIIREAEVPALYDNLGMAMEDVADSYRINNEPLMKLLDVLKPNEEPPWAQEDAETWAAHQAMKEAAGA